MFEHGTVFVVGAGGSHELGLPTGLDLMDKISQCLAVATAPRRSFANKDIEETIKTIARQKNVFISDELESCIDAATRLTKALPFALSIDNLLDAHREDEHLVFMGKIGIAYAILDSELNSNLRAFVTNDPLNDEMPTIFRDKILDFRSSWYPLLMRLLNAGLPLHELERVFENVSFVTFNYDRCLEYYMYNGLRFYYSISANDAARIMRNVRIVHIYGSLGAMPWENVPDEEITPFGSLNPHHLEVSANRIQTFTQVVSSQIQTEAVDMVASAQTLVFMGFGFLPQNINVLRCKVHDLDRVFVTTKGIGEGDVPLIVHEIYEMLMPADAMNIPHSERFTIHIERGTCAELLRNNWVRLTR